MDTRQLIESIATMTIHISDTKIRAQTMTFEARFDDAWKYLDRCGETISLIRQHDRNWVISNANVQSTVLLHSTTELVIRFDSNKVILTRNVSDKISVAKSDELAKQLSAATPPVYAIIYDTLQIRNTTRVGARFSFLAPADSLEEAEHCVTRNLESPISKFIASNLNGEFYQADCQLRFEEERSGYRRMARIGVRTENNAEDAPQTGLRSDKVNSFLSIDIDTFTKPEAGHFEQTDLFINTAYTRSRELALSVFREMVKR